jgi:hypothetical protein
VRIPSVPGTKRELPLKVGLARSLLSSGTVAPGGECAYSSRLGKDRSTRQSCHSTTSALNGPNDIEIHVFANEAHRPGRRSSPNSNNLGKAHRARRCRISC